MTSFATRQLIREAMIDELQVLPELLRKAEKQYYNARNAVAVQRERLLAAESKLFLGGTVAAVNESARLAELWPITGAIHADIRQSEAESDRLRVEVDFLRRKLENLHAIARLLSESDESAY